MLKEITKYKRDISLYLLFIDRVYDDMTVLFKLPREDVRRMLWVYHINKYIFRQNFINVKRTSIYMKDIGVFVDERTLKKTIEKFVEIDHMTKKDDIYVLDVKIGAFIRAMSNTFTTRINEFDIAVNDPDRKLRFSRKYSRVSLRVAKKNGYRKKKSGKRRGRPRKVTKVS